MAAKIDIFNTALVSHLGTDRLTDPNQPGQYAQKVRDCYRLIKPATIIRHPWISSLHREEVSADAEKPKASSYERRYRLPGDCLKPWWIHLDNEQPSRFRTEGRYILTDRPSPIPLRYGRDVPEAQMDPDLADALAIGLAWRLCRPLSRSTKERNDLQEAYEAYIAQAEFTDSQGTNRDRGHNESILDSRTQGYPVPYGEE